MKALKDASALTGCCGMALSLVSCCGDGSPATATTPANTATASGLSLAVFAQAPASNNKPDSIVQSGKPILIGYQNAGDVKDGSVAGLANSVVQYDLSGNLLNTYSVPGHVDGLLARGDTNSLWAMANEDGNPLLTIIDLGTGSQKAYSPTLPTAHGGGFDDLQLISGVVYVSASNPTTPGAAPTVDALTLNGSVAIAAHA